MTEPHDPVDSALDRLRSDSWTGRAYDPELENRLMQEFNQPKSAARSAGPRILAIAVALLLVSGATFAATGGIDKVTGWFVTIEMGDEVIDLTLDENGEATIRRETDDGGLTTVSVKKGTTPDGGETTTPVTRAVARTAKAASSIAWLVQRAAGGAVDASSACGHHPRRG